MRDGTVGNNVAVPILSVSMGRGDPRYILGVILAVENGFRFRHPFTVNITGPTGCGKTYFAKALLQNYWNPR
jgi:predicted AAA+ superfamily ATPase